MNQNNYPLFCLRRLCIAFIPLAVPAARGAVNYYSTVEIQPYPTVTTINSTSDNYNLVVGTGNITTGSANIVQGEENTVSGTQNMAIGDNHNIQGWESLVVGTNHEINHSDSSANFIFGQNNYISDGASYSMAGGTSTTVIADSAVALGALTRANTYASMVIGQYNAFLPGETDSINAKVQWRLSDPLFVVGNGPTGSDRKNAFVITKGGAVSIPSGSLTVSGGLSAGGVPWGGNTAAGPNFSTGPNSVAFGYGATASAGAAFAAGDRSTASGQSSTALGYMNLASGNQSFAAGHQSKAQNFAASVIGHGNEANGRASFAGGYLSGAAGDYSTALGLYTHTAGEGSAALGQYTTANGTGSFAAGSWSYAAGAGALAVGAGNTAYGSASGAIGSGSYALTDTAFAVGDNNSAWQRGQTVVGRYNAFPAHPVGQWGETLPLPQPDTTYDETDAVLVVGGGYPTANGPVRKNALTVQANGDTTVTGTLKVSKPIILEPSAIAGDIPMYTGN
ncbi:MAG: hypothetical protein V4726_19055 [Verrucomicrobiota bacterium]